MMQKEYSATEIRAMLQQLFPQRKLVLSQFTFFSHAGVSRASGMTFKRGRRCYLLRDILPIACVLALKEQGIPLKNIESLPQQIQQYSELIFQLPSGCRISGYGTSVALSIPGVVDGTAPLGEFLSEESQGTMLFWSYDISALARQLEVVAATSELEHIDSKERQAA